MTILSRPQPLTPVTPTHTSSRWLLYETLIVLVLTVGLSLLLPPAKGLLSFLPLVYLLIEHFVRRHAWGELGLRRDNLRAALAGNWLLILLVAVVVQAAVVVLARLWWPALLEHIQARVPLFDRATTGPLVVLLLVGPFIEELTFRGLFQARLSGYMTALAANLLVSVPFALLHWTAGVPALVALDVALVALDSVIYGLIFTRGQNLWVAWMAHTLADIVGLALLLL